LVVELILRRSTDPAQFKKLAFCIDDLTSILLAFEVTFAVLAFTSSERSNTACAGYVPVDSLTVGITQFRQWLYGSA
jgi:hypothetical protein